MCSTTLGPAIWPSLVTWPTSSTAVPFCLAKRISASDPAFSCDTVPGAASIDRRPQRLDRIDDRDRRRLAFAQRGDDVRDIGFGRKQHRRIVKPKPLGPQPHLGDGFLARDVDDALALAGQGGQGLKQQRRLADARIAADQHAGARHEAAARHPVQFADAGDDAGRCRALALQAHQARGACPWAGSRPWRRTPGPPPASSTIEFHAPQLSQRPDHFDVVVPQDWQTKAEVLAMPHLARTISEHKCGFDPRQR